MGCCKSTSINKKNMTNLQIDFNHEVEKNLLESTNASAICKKLLLLGSGSSGKSTLFRQLKCVYSDGFQNNDILETIPIIRINCVSGMLVLLKKSQELYEMHPNENKDCYINLEHCDKHLIECVTTVVSFRNCAFDILDEQSGANDMKQRKQNMAKLSDSIQHLWKLSHIQTTFEKRRKYLYSFPDNMDYFFEATGRIFTWGYKPTIDDIIKSRIRTTGLIEDQYDMQKVSFTITDVGGQRNERRKWIHSFENVTAVLFVAALSHYACVLFEDETKNAMIESIELFRDICNSKYFKRSEIVLFLNKDDVFRNCIRKDIALSICFNAENKCVTKGFYRGRSYWPKENVKPKLDCEYDHTSFAAEDPSGEVKDGDDDNLLNYQASCAIYPKLFLRHATKETFHNGEHQPDSDNDWFDFVYKDYLYFITAQYLSKNYRQHRNIFVHVTTATNQNNVETVFWNVQHIIIKSNLAHGGMLMIN